MKSSLVNEARNLLIEQKQEMVEHLKLNNRPFSYELSNYDNHSGEQATELFFGDTPLISNVFSYIL